jgi:hypothetical protein
MCCGMCSTLAQNHLKVEEKKKSNKQILLFYFLCLKGAKGVIRALGVRLNGITLRNCLEIITKFYAKKNEQQFVVRIPIFLLLSQNRLRELIIFMAQKIASYPNSDIISFISKVRKEKL